MGIERHELILDRNSQDCLTFTSNKQIHWLIDRLHYNIYASSWGASRVTARVSLVIRDIEKIFTAAEVIFLAFLAVFTSTEASCIAVYTQCHLLSLNAQNRLILHQILIFLCILTPKSLLQHVRRTYSKNQILSAFARFLYLYNGFNGFNNNTVIAKHTVTYGWYLPTGSRTALPVYSSFGTSK